MKTALLAIDPQVDFCDMPEAPGALAVKGAHEDMQRLGAFLDEAGQKVNEVYVSLDTHSPYDIAHPSYWIEAASGQAPNPFTPISAEQIQSRAFVTADENLQDEALRYARNLEAQGGKKGLFIWPEHCLEGSPGGAIHPEFRKSIAAWERAHRASARYERKGQNATTEHYSIFKAEVPDPLDPATKLNEKLLGDICLADVVFCGGEALSHCIAESLRDLTEYVRTHNLGCKVILLSDCSSPVADFEAAGEAFCAEFKKTGGAIMDSKEALALLRTTAPRP